MSTIGRMSVSFMMRLPTVTCFGVEDTAHELVWATT